MKNWLLLVLALPTANATERMRAWRALKACGAAVLRDGVYLLPEQDAGREAFESVERDVTVSGGTAFLLAFPDEETRFAGLFDRSEEYSKLRDEVAACREGLLPENALQVARQVRKLRKSFAQLALIDFFPGVAKQQTETALEALETAISRALSPDEPHIQDHPVTLLDHSHYQGRRWATRRLPGSTGWPVPGSSSASSTAARKSSGWNPRATAPPMHWALTSMAPRSAMSGTASPSKP